MTTRAPAVQINPWVDALALWNLGRKNLLLCNDCGKNILIHHPCEAVLWNQAFFRQQKKKTKTEGSIDYVILQRRNFRQVPFVLKYYIKMFMTRLFAGKAPMQRYPRLDSRQGARDGIASKKCHTHRSKGSRQRLCGGGKISDKRFSGFCFLQKKNNWGKAGAAEPKATKRNLLMRSPLPFDQTRGRDKINCISSFVWYHHRSSIGILL